MARLRWVNAALAMLLLLAPKPLVAGGIVSLNLCTDQWLVRLAPERIAALTPLARDPSISAVAVDATRFPMVRPDAEAVLRLKPDLVLVGAWGGLSTAALLRVRGVPLERIDDPQNFAGITATIAHVAEILGRPAQGRALNAAMQSALPQLGDANRQHLRAVIWQARGLTAGPGSLGDSVLRAAGYHNIGTGGTMSLEALITAKPDLVVVDEQPRFPSLATDLFRNPALRRLAVVALPPAWLTCGGPDAARAVARIAQP